MPSKLSLASSGREGIFLKNAGMSAKSFSSVSTRCKGLSNRLPKLRIYPQQQQECLQSWWLLEYMDELGYEKYFERTWRTSVFYKINSV
jgi:hypothetical protein